ncbi:hypothetical protein FQA47_012355 [Oryzias melastigma]|uniref:Uncharacterized protein n=1 Tax=Oryzias melastigma TaxID=30732 RepID=A0A834C6J7_ORYME|nr:hypothetical protein FQA47_012355 [Oryzias melastigma]
MSLGPQFDYEEQKMVFSSLSLPRLCSTDKGADLPQTEMSPNIEKKEKKQRIFYFVCFRHIRMAQWTDCFFVKKQKSTNVEGVKKYQACLWKTAFALFRCRCCSDVEIQK